MNMNFDEELVKKMENVENDPEGALIAAEVVLGKYGRNRGWKPITAEELDSIMKEEFDYLE